MGTVVKYPGMTRHEVSAQDVLEGALQTGLDDVVIVGYTHAGEFFFASSKADGALVVWLLEYGRHKLMQLADDQIEGRI